MISDVRKHISHCVVGLTRTARNPASTSGARAGEEEGAAVAAASAVGASGPGSKFAGADFMLIQVNFKNVRNKRGNMKQLLPWQQS
jgi:hypothetical protein